MTKAAPAVRAKQRLAFPVQILAWASDEKEIAQQIQAQR
jgi:hypothetical protein